MNWFPLYIYKNVLKIRIGGGVIQINVGRTLTLNGEILSNGANSPLPLNLTLGVSAGAG